MPVRVIELALGRRLQATVVEIGDLGSVTIGVLGTKISAYSKLQLLPGASYEFTVRAIQPRLVLVAEVPANLGTELGRSSVADAANSVSGLGVSGSVLSTLLRVGAELESKPLVRVGLDPFRPSSDSASRADGSSQWARGSGVSSNAESLAYLHRALGHDLEGRVLRAARSKSVGRGPDPSDSPSALRDTLKARALAWIAEPGADSRNDGARRTLAALVEGLSGIERENARRSEHGAPLWMPLPADPDRGVLDARMFLFLASDRDPGRDGRSRDAEGGVTIVLLLELSNLGALRVDLGVCSEELTIDVETVEVASLRLLRAASAELRANLESHGLSVRRLEVRQAPGQRLTVNDLLALPSDSERPSGDRVDVHV